MQAWTQKSTSVWILILTYTMTLDKMCNRVLEWMDAYIDDRKINGR